MSKITFELRQCDKLEFMLECKYNTTNTDLQDKVLNAIYENYFDYEVSYYSKTLFYLKMKARLNSIMEYYDRKYELLYTTTADTSTVTSNGNSTTSSSGESTSNVYDTPQTQLGDIEQDYLTAKNSNNSTSSANGETESTTTATSESIASKMAISREVTSIISSILKDVSNLFIMIYDF